MTPDYQKKYYAEWLIRHPDYHRDWHRRRQARKTLIKMEGELMRLRELVEVRADG